jgi:hypothetical protein
MGTSIKFMQTKNCESIIDAETGDGSCAKKIEELTKKLRENGIDLKSINVTNRNEGEDDSKIKVQC